MRTVLVPVLVNLGPSLAARALLGGTLEASPLLEIAAPLGAGAVRRPEGKKREPWLEAANNAYGSFGGEPAVELNRANANRTGTKTTWEVHGRGAASDQLVVIGLVLTLPKGRSATALWREVADALEPVAAELILGARRQSRTRANTRANTLAQTLARTLVRPVSLALASRLRRSPTRARLDRVVVHAWTLADLEAKPAVVRQSVRTRARGVGRLSIRAEGASSIVEAPAALGTASGVRLLAPTASARLLDLRQTSGVWRAHGNLGKAVAGSPALWHSDKSEHAAWLDTSGALWYLRGNAAPVAVARSLAGRLQLSTHGEVAELKITGGPTPRSFVGARGVLRELRANEDPAKAAAAIRGRAPHAQPAAIRAAARIDPRLIAGAMRGARLHSRAAIRPGARPAIRPGARPVIRPGARPAIRPGARPAIRPGARPRPRPRPQAQPRPQPDLGKGLDPTRIAGAPTAASELVSAHAGKLGVVAYLGIDGHLHALERLGPRWTHVDLSADHRAPVVASALTLTSLGADSLAIYYATPIGSLAELRRQRKGWVFHNVPLLTTA